MQFLLSVLTRHQQNTDCLKLSILKTSTAAGNWDTANLFIQTSISAKALTFSYIAVDASPTQSVNTPETFSGYQYRIIVS